ncbi:MAG: glycerol-3-phosphate 1-O-acyltransferase PlsY [Pseudomonadota bacterium]
MDFFSATIALAIGYLAGSIPTGLLLSHAFGHGDVRATGSGNIGATNALRHGGKLLGVATLAGDLAKGIVGVLLGAAVMGGARMFGTFGIGGDVTGAALGGVGAFLGHLYPVWLRFRGGKGVATLIGVLLALDWPFALAFCGVWLAVAVTTKISSLSALVATALVSVGTLIFRPSGLAFAVFFMALLVFWRHRENITRISSGEEPRIGGARASQSDTKS